MGSLLVLISAMAISSMPNTPFKEMPHFYKVPVNGTINIEFLAVGGNRTFIPQADYDRATLLSSFDTKKFTYNKDISGFLTPNISLATVNNKTADTYLQMFNFKFLGSVKGEFVINFKTYNQSNPKESATSFVATFANSSNYLNFGFLTLL